MNCKYCGAELDAEKQICPTCGKDNTEEVLQETEIAVEENCEVSEVKTETKEKAVKENKPEKKPAKKLSKQQKKVAKIITGVVVCVVLAFFLVATICDSVGISLHPGANTLQYKKSYGASDAVATMASKRVVATVGDAQLTNGELQVYYWMAYYEFLNYYGSYLSSIGLDPNVALDKQYIPDKSMTWEQHFLETALQNWHRYQSVQQAADDAGFETPKDTLDALAKLPAEIEAAAEAEHYKSVDAYVVANAGVGSTFEDYLGYITLYNTSLDYYNHLYGSLEPTLEEVEQCFAENAEDFNTNYGITKDSGRLVDVRHILIYPKSAEGKTTYTEADWEACREEAQRVLDEWKAGEATEQSFAELANAISEDPGSNTAGGLYSFIYEGQMVQEFEDWCFDESREYGDTGIVRTGYGYHIMYFVYGEEGWYRYAVDALAGDYCSEQMELFAQTYPLDVNYKKIVIAKADGAA